MKKLFRKNFTLFILLFLSFSLLIPNIYANKNINLGFQIDQYQDNEGDFNMILGTFKISQSFKPNLTPLVKVDLFGYSINDGNSLEVIIRENLGGQDLTHVSIPPEEIPVQLSWFECDFPDIEVDLEKNYYIIINQIGDGNFIWYGNYENDFYKRGYPYSNQENTQGWVNLSTIFENLDFCFKTYSYGDNQPPSSPIINGSISGKIGETYNFDFFSIDPEGDDLYYRIDWGDGINSQWYGPYESEEIVSFSYVWDEKGDFIIKIQSKDIYGDKSEWSLFEFSIVKRNMVNKNIFLTRIFQRYPFISHILKNINF